MLQVGAACYADVMIVHQNNRRHAFPARCTAQRQLVTVTAVLLSEPALPSVLSLSVSLISAGSSHRAQPGMVASHFGQWRL